MHLKTQLSKMDEQSKGMEELLIEMNENVKKLGVKLETIGRENQGRR